MTDIDFTCGIDNFEETRAWFDDWIEKMHGIRIKEKKITNWKERVERLENGT